MVYGRGGGACDSRRRGSRSPQWRPDRACFASFVVAALVLVAYMALHGRAVASDAQSAREARYAAALVHCELARAAGQLPGCGK